MSRASGPVRPSSAGRRGECVEGGRRSDVASAGSPARRSDWRVGIVEGPRRRAGNCCRRTATRWTPSDLAASVFPPLPDKRGRPAREPGRLPGWRTTRTACVAAGRTAETDCPACAGSWPTRTASDVAGTRRRTVGSFRRRQRASAVVRSAASRPASLTTGSTSYRECWKIG